MKPVTDYSKQTCFYCNALPAGETCVKHGGKSPREDEPHEFVVDPAYLHTARDYCSICGKDKFNHDTADTPVAEHSALPSICKTCGNDFDVHVLLGPDIICPKPTSTPWRYQGWEDDGAFIVGGGPEGSAREHLVAAALLQPSGTNKIECISNAKLIVQAVNERAELIAALRESLKFLRVVSPTAAILRRLRAVLDRVEKG